MRERMVGSEAEAKEAIIEAEAAGFRVAAVSNVACPPGKRRLTFLPVSAFKEVPEKMFPDGETEKKLET